MEYNWSDPRKNSLIGNLMMAKTEASRMKRLTSVKSTVSNQLHPSIEHKLKQSKKKKPGDTLDGRPSSRLHQRPFDSDTTGNGSSNNNSSHSSGRSTSSFYNEFLPVAAKLPDVFDSIDVHAAADGLFHPASDVQAFAEHDSKYQTRKSVSRAPTVGVGPENTDRRLPPLSGKSDRAGSRSDARLPTASVASLSHGHHRSEGDLHAPRRVGLVPSSADRGAMELGGEIDTNTNQQTEHQPQSRSKATKPVVRTNTNSKKPLKPKASVVPPLELDLTQKFESLKQLLHTNREKHAQPTTSPGPEVDDDAAPTRTAHQKLETENGTKKKKSAKTGKADAELKHRNGVSLTDLKDEHRAALALLQELGGPMEPDCHAADAGTKKSKSTKSSLTHTRSIKPRDATATATSVQPTRSAPRLVDRLRSSTLSGRSEDESRELAAAAIDAARQALDAGPSIRIPSAASNPEKDEELWNRYSEDKDPEEREEEEDDPSAELYDDEPFES